MVTVEERNGQVVVTDAGRKRVFTKREYEHIQRVQLETGAPPKYVAEPVPIPMPSWWEPTGTEVITPAGGMTLTPEAYKELVKAAPPVSPTVPERVLEKSQDWARHPPTKAEQTKVYTEAGIQWDPYAKEWTEPVKIEKITPTEAVKAAEYAAVAGIELPEIEEIKKMTKGEEEYFLIRPPTELEERKRYWHVARITSPEEYYGAYVTSLGIVTPSAFGEALRTIARPLFLPPEEAKEREIEALARRTLAFERAPVRYTAFKAAEIPMLYGGAWGFGAVQAKLAVAAPVAASYFGVGTKLFGAAAITARLAPPIIRKEPVEVVGRIAEIGAAFPFAYTGYKAGVEWMLEKEYPKILARELGIDPKKIEKEIKLAREAGKLPREKIKSIRSVVNKMPSMKGKRGRVILDFIQRNRNDIIVGGSVAERTQVGGRAPKDIDLYVRGDPKAFRESLLSALREAGILVTKGAGGKILYNRKTLVDIHTVEHLEGLRYYAGSTRTPDDVNVMDITGQFFRKVIGKYEPGQWPRRAKDIPAFERMVTSVIRTGEIRAEEAFPLFRPFREARVTKVERLFRGMGRKGYAYPSYKMPKTSFVPLITPPLKYVYKPPKVKEPPTYPIGFKELKPYVEEKPYKIPKLVPYKAPKALPYKAPSFPDLGKISIPYPPDKKFIPKPIVYPKEYPKPKPYEPAFGFPGITYPPYKPEEPIPTVFPKKIPLPKIEFEFKPKWIEYKKPKKVKVPKKYRPSIAGIAVGKFIKAVPRERLTGLEVRYPVARKDRGGINLMKFSWGKKRRKAKKKPKRKRKKKR